MYAQRADFSMHQAYTAAISTADHSCQQLPWQTNSRSRSQPPSCISFQSSCNANKGLLVLILVLLHVLQAACARTLQQAGTPCVACEDCVTSSCFRVCVPSCKAGNNMPEGSSLSTDQCKHKGQESALDIATAACKLSQITCEFSSKLPAHFAVASTVSASQCAALANSSCQKMASSSTYSPCGANQYFGHRTCSGRQFSDIYKVKVGELCLAAMHKLG